MDTKAALGRGLSSGLRCLLPTLFSVTTALGQATAIVGATVIDGNGGPPVADATIVIEGSRIAALGSRSTIRVPRGAAVVDGTGKFVVPGLIDVNNHLTGVGFLKELFPLVAFGQPDAIVDHGYALEAAQMALKAGVTTIRDSYGPLPPLLTLRDRIARGEAIGPRLQVAGDIIGWNGGPDGCNGDRPIDESWCDYFSGYVHVGVELTTMYPDQVRARINQYLDLKPDFIKIGITSHGYRPVNLTFSPRVARAIVEEAHRRGLKVDVHSSSAEGILAAVDAGADLITHAGILGRQEISDEIVAILREKQITCALFTNFSVGPAARMAEKPPGTAADSSNGTEAIAREIWPFRDRRERLPRTAAQRYRDGGGPIDVEMLRRNDAKLIKGGCRIAVGTDNAPTIWPELASFRGPMPDFNDPGIGTLIAVEGLVTLGMTPGDAIVAATKHGAMAAGKLDQLGTLEVGKLADLLLLRADPLADIRNLRALEWVMIGGRRVDPATLPTRPMYYHR